MSECTLLSISATEMAVRHDRTGHVFTYRLVGEELLPGPVREGPGPKGPGDVAADAHAFAQTEARRLGRQDP